MFESRLKPAIHRNPGRHGCERGCHPLAHDRVGALQRGSVWQLHLNEGVTLIFFRDKTGWQALAHQSSNHRQSQE